MKTINMKWTGIRPLLMHNGHLVDATNSYVKGIKKITDKGSKKMTDKDRMDRDRLEWEGSLYWDEELGPVIPSDNIERCLQLGAQKQRKGKDVQAAVLCSEPLVKLHYDGPRNKDKLFASDRFTLKKSIRVQQSRLIRTRPMFPTGWWIEFSVEYDPSVISDDSLIMDAAIDAGALVGLGDWRPKFGRFIVD